MTQLLRELAQALPDVRASADDADRLAYARDLWPRHHFAVRSGRPAEHRPGAIVWPTAPDEVAQLVRWASARGIALVPFGAGSGVCGGILPREDVVIVDLKRMARIRAIDPGGPTLCVEAGHMGVPLEQALGRAGFTLGHFPSSILCSTVGGWIAARSAGQCSGAYGKIEDMVVALECVTGRGDVVLLRTRTSDQDLVPLVVGSEGTLAIVTAATLRLHPSPGARGFGAWSFPSTERGLDAMRELFQRGLRPAVARLYDPFDAMLAKRGGRKGPRREPQANGPASPGLGGAALQSLLVRPQPLNALLHSSAAARMLGGAMLVVVFESPDEGAAKDGVERARTIVESQGGAWLGEAPARAWLARRYAISYRQAPVFVQGAFVDTMEVAARWSKIGAVYEGVRRALGPTTFVMAHFGHAYPDGCCIYFTFAGSADPAVARAAGWDAACEATYDRAWKAALLAASDAGGTIAHHHGVGRSKAPRLERELGAGVDVVRAVMHAFDPAGILNPGNLVPTGPAPGVGARKVPVPPAASEPPSAAPLLEIDHASLLVCLDGTADLENVEESLRRMSLTLDVGALDPGVTIADWLARGAPGARDRFRDPVDQLLAGFDATLADGRRVSLVPAPRRAVGPDLSALFVGARGRYGRIDRAWLRVHRLGSVRPTAPAFDHERDPPLNETERALTDAIGRATSAG